MEDLVANRLDMSIRVGNRRQSPAIRHIRPKSTGCWWPDGLLLPPVERRFARRRCIITACRRWSGMVW